MRYISSVMAAILLQGCIVCLTGCGAPLYPERSFSVNPHTGQVNFSSTQEEDLVVGQFSATVNPLTGDKTITLGTTTQPAIVYGAKSVAAMEAYVKQQDAYTKMLDVVGKNTTEQIRALGEWIPGISGMLTGLGATPAQVSSAVAPAQLLLEKLKAQQQAVSSCTGSNCGQ